MQSLNAVSRQIWRGCHTSVNSGDLSQAPPKQSAVCSTCIIPAPPVNCQFIWMASAFGIRVPPNLSWGDARPYAVLQRTLDKDCRQTEEPKQLVDEASRFYIWGASANTLRSSALALCYSAAEYCTTAPQSGHALLTQVRSMCSWTLPCASSLVLSVLHLSHGFQCSQNWTASPTKEGCHWQAGGENRQTWQLANPAWYPLPTIAATDIQKTAVAGLATSWYQKSMEA